MSDDETKDGSSELPDPPSADDIEARARAARKLQRQAAPQPTMDADSSKGLGIGLSAAYAIIGLPLVGAGVGWLIDRALGITAFVVVGVVGGLIGGIFHAIQLSNRA